MSPSNRAANGKAHAVSLRVVNANSYTCPRRAMPFSGLFKARTVRVLVHALLATSHQFAERNPRVGLFVLFPEQPLVTMRDLMVGDEPRGITLD
jgi:hypothetical protein